MLKVGMLGFGRIGKELAKAIIQTEDTTIDWVLRKTVKDVNKYASDVMRINNKGKEGKIYSLNKLNLKLFFQQNPVDIIVDISSFETFDKIKDALPEHFRYISVISNYEPKAIEDIKGLGRKGAVLYSPNITVGINILMNFAQKVKAFLPDLEIKITETHFKEKKEKSGTAIKIASKLGVAKKDVVSIREEKIIGIHTVEFIMDNQIIKLEHQSLDITAFSQGILFMINWIKHRKKGFYYIEDIFEDELSRSSLVL
jgi:4-hydroxy-tetrahydrodipicolinate reductase